MARLSTVKHPAPTRRSSKPHSPTDSFADSAARLHRTLAHRKATATATFAAKLKCKTAAANERDFLVMVEEFAALAIQDRPTVASLREIEVVEVAARSVENPTVSTTTSPTSALSAQQDRTAKPRSSTPATGCFTTTTEPQLRFNPYGRPIRSASSPSPPAPSSATRSSRRPLLARAGPAVFTPTPVLLPQVAELPELAPERFAALSLREEGEAAPLPNEAVALSAPVKLSSTSSASSRQVQRDSPNSASLRTTDPRRRPKPNNRLSPYARPASSSASSTSAPSTSSSPSASSISTSTTPSLSPYWSARLELLTARNPRLRSRSPPAPVVAKPKSILLNPLTIFPSTMATVPAKEDGFRSGDDFVSFAIEEEEEDEGEGEGGDQPPAPTVEALDIFDGAEADLDNEDEDDEDDEAMWSKSRLLTVSVDEVDRKYRQSAQAQSVPASPPPCYSPPPPRYAGFVEEKREEVDLAEVVLSGIRGEFELQKAMGGLVV
ncbi:hypothetical protein JCM8097_005785 [Rhodosporidiobolus ruineniae]